jgi:transcriptional regulator with XRE-family HTH domain
MKTKTKHSSMDIVSTKILHVGDRQEINNQIGSFFKDLRKARGISQYYLGIAVGLSEEVAQQQIYKYENSIIRIPIDIAITIAKVLNVEMIINGDNIIFIPNENPPETASISHS